MQRQTFKRIASIMSSIEADLIRSAEENTGTTPDGPLAQFGEINALIATAKPMSTRQRRRFSKHLAKVDAASSRHAHMLVNHPDSGLTRDEKRATYECLTSGKTYPG